MRGRLGAIVAALLASCATSSAPRSTRSSLGIPLFPPGAVDSWPHEPSVSPQSSSDAVSGESTSAPDTVSGKSSLIPAAHDLIGTCSRDANAGSALCEALTGGYDQDCVKVCLDTYAAAHAKPRPPTPPAPPGMPSISQVAPAGGPSPSPPPDPYAFALRDCILRVRDSGGAEPAVCHFDAPLDAMGFGQRHCDARCAALTEAYRASGARRPSGSE